MTTDFERAKKEQETIQYLTANTNMADMKALYKLYKMSVEKKSFQTIIWVTIFRRDPEKTDRFRCGRKRLVRTDTGTDCHGEESQKNPVT